MNTTMLYSSKPIPSWDEAIPLGNGVCGALLWGKSNCLRFSLDRSDIWDNSPSRCTQSPDFSYRSLVQFVQNGHADKIDEILEAPCTCDPTPTKLPVGKLLFDFGEETIQSQLNLHTAETTLSIGKNIQLHTFIHATRKVGFIKINQPLSAFSVQLANPQFGTLQTDETSKESDFTFESLPSQSLQQLHYPLPKIVDQPNLKYFTQQISNGDCYGVFLHLQEKDGHTELVYSVGNSADGSNWVQDTLSLLQQALAEGYETAFATHTAWWSEYWSKSSICLPDKFFEKNWYLTQYFLACCSRRGGYPMPLQGVWTADNDALPPWKGDYHLDLNVEMSYFSYLKANHHEEGLTLFDFLWNLREVGHRFADTFYDAQGLCMPSTMTITGDTLGGWAGYSFSPTNQLWLCQLFYRHYCGTGDLEFLQNRAYPYMEESARCLLSLLQKKDGKYHLPISTSPEIHDNTLDSYLTPNSNYDLALMRSLFTCLAQSSQILQNGMEQYWLDILQDLPALAVNEQGVLMLSPDEELQESHRHMSHAMSIYPLRLIPYKEAENKAIIDATLFDLQRLGTGNWVGYSFAWIAALYAVQKNGNAAAHQLGVFWKNYCSPNGFHLNGDYKNCGTSIFHYRPFTLEGNFCAADALQEMLLFSECGELELFPAIPDSWLEDEVSFTDFCTEKGLLVSAKMEQGIVTQLTLKPQYTGCIQLRINDHCQALANQIDSSHTDGTVSLYLQANTEYSISL